MNRAPVGSGGRSPQRHVMSVTRRLAWFGVAYGVLHHTGFVLDDLGTLGGARWADWLDLATPYLVLLPAGAALLAAGPSAGQRNLWLFGALVYASGHGIHLAANAIAAVDPSDAAHLWDEFVGHLIWYGGLWLVVTALRLSVGERMLKLTPLGYLVALWFGITHATNALEGGVAVPGLVVAVAFSAWAAAWWGESASRLMAAAYVPATAVIAGYGLIHGGFPQPSSL